LPVEKVETLHSFHGLMEMIEGCKSMSTEADLEILADTVEAQTQQVNQLLKCMKTAVTDSNVTLLITMFACIRMYYRRCFLFCVLCACHNRI
jgi:hypothetical protein